MKSRRRIVSRRLAWEPLEDRLTPTSTPFASLYVDPFGDTGNLARLGYTQQSWLGTNSYVVPGQWVASFTGMTGGRLQQLAIMKLLVDSNSGPSGGNLQVLDQLGSSGTFLFETDPSLPYSEVLNLLSPLGSLRYVEPNFALKQSAIPTDPSYPSQWALNNTGASGGVVDADIDAPEAWDLATGSSGVVVGVIDSGVMYTHPDLVASMWVNPGEVAGDGLDNDGNGYIDDVYGYDFANNDSDPMDDDGHGTAVSGIIAAATNNGIGIAGINWGGKIMALKYARAEFVASTADVIEAVNYATMMRRDYGVNIRATNNSYGVFGSSQALADAIQAGGDEGILFVASAGNSNTDNDFGPQYPASYTTDAVLSVAATTRQDLRASFSSFGATSVDLGAPGVDVLTTRLGGGYSGFNGTSAAAPVVAGVAALLWDYAPYATLQEIRAAILDGTDPLPALAGITVTGGRVNAFNSMLELGFVVQEIAPQFNSIVNSPPKSFSVRFSQEYDPASVDASDLLINGIAADDFTLVDANTISFHFNTSPVTTEGLQTLALVDASIHRLVDLDAVTGMSATFRYDVQPLAVVSTIPIGGSSQAVPLTAISLIFNEAIDPESLQIRDLVISQGKVTGVVATGPNSIQFHLTGVEKEGLFSLSIPAGAIKDLSGNPSSLFQATLDLDVNQRSLDHSFERIGPLGGLVFASLGNIGLINQQEDLDDFTFYLQEGETATAVVKPTDLAASIAAQWLRIGENINSPTPGGSLTLPIFTAPTSGLYSIRISADRPTSYTFDIYRNALLEIADSTDVNPLSLAPSFLSIGDGRYAVVGKSDLSRLVWTMDTSPGWTLGSQWAWGQPTGQGGDPNSGFTGVNVVGNNLNGLYNNRLTSTNYTTLGPLNLTGKSDVTLSFRRWLGVESSTLDRANIQISRNAVNWTTVWQHSGPTLQEDSWSLQTYDISAVADNQPTVYVRFGIGPTSTSNAFAGWNIDDVAIRGKEDGPAKTIEQDVYSLDLSASVGNRIDIALAGLAGVDYSNSQLELIGPDGTTTVRAGVTTTSGVEATSADLVIEDYLVEQPGIHQVILRTQKTGQYTIIVTDNITLETEPNSQSPGPARSIDETSQAIGYVGIPELLGSKTFSVDSSQSLLTMTARLFLTNGALELPIVEQTPGSLDAQMAGTFTVHRSDAGITFQSANLDVLANAGSFLPGGSPADLAAQVNLFGLVANAAIRNILFTLSSGLLPVDENGFFDASGLNYEFTDGQISYSALGMTDTFPVNTPDIPNAPGMQGRIEFIPGAARITIPLGLQFVANVPLGFNIEFNFQATIVATTPMPINDTDAYTINLTSGEALEFSVAAINLPARPASEFLDATIQVLGPAGEIIPLISFHDPNSSLATHRFSATQAGNYRLIVGAADGFGEYLLSAQKVAPPQVQIDAPATAVRGEPVPFTLHVVDTSNVVPTEEYTFHIDWNNDGIVDESVVGPSGIVVEHVFETDANQNVGITATRFDGITSDQTQSSINIVAMMTRPNMANPTLTDLVIGGTTGIDAYLFFGRLMFVLMENNKVFGTVLANGQLVGTVDLRPIPAFNGNLIVYAQAGSDLISAELVFQSVILYGGDGDDILQGGLANDFIDGGAGNDFLEGDTFGLGGNDTILGHAGNDILVGGKGADLLRGGAGSDLVIAGPLVLPGYPLTGRYALQAEWRSNRNDADRFANVIGAGVGPRFNSDYFLTPGVTIFDDNAVDQVFGDEDQDFFFANVAQDSLADRDDNEELVSL